MTTAWDRAKPERRDFILTTLEALRGGAQDVAGVASQLETYIAGKVALPLDDDHHKRLSEYLVRLVEPIRGGGNLRSTAETLVELIAAGENGEIAFYRKIQE